MTTIRSRWRLLVAVAVIFAVGGVSGGLHVVAGGVIGIALGVVLVLAYGYCRRHRTR